MKLAAVGVTNLKMMQTPLQNQSNARIDWDLKNNSHARIQAYWDEKNYPPLAKDVFETSQEIYLEVGAGSGTFFSQMAQFYPDKFHVAIERDRMRGKALVKKNKSLGLKNFLGVRGNAIPMLLTGIPSNRLERLYILYPCPWEKSSQRHNRWHLSAAMSHLVRILKPGGQLIWASDQKFYIDEAAYVCEKSYGLKVLAFGEITPNAYNDLDKFEGGRTKFERTFLKSGQPCYELIVSKPH